MHRREFLAASAATATALWGAPAPAGGRDDRPAPLVERWLRVESAQPFGRDCLLLVPEHATTEPLPLLVLLHGYGATTSAATSRAARGRYVADTWRRDYAVERAHQRLVTPPIEPIYRTVRYLGDERSRAINATLDEQPYRGVALACPRVPVPYYRHPAGPVFPTYADWVEQALLPTLRSSAEVAASASATGIAGHSMGAQVALEVFLRKPELFGAVSGVQIAVTERAAVRYATRIRATLDRVGPRRLQVVTSTRDPYRAANRRFADELARHGVPVDVRESFGAHTGSWMREIGSLETLLFHDRALRGG